MNYYYTYRPTTTKAHRLYWCGWSSWAKIKQPGDEIKYLLMQPGTSGFRHQNRLQCFQPIPVQVSRDVTLGFVSRSDAGVSRSWSSSLTSPKRLSFHKPKSQTTRRFWRLSALLPSASNWTRIFCLDFGGVASWEREIQSRTLETELKVGKCGAFIGD